MKKRILSVLLALMLALPLIPAIPASADIYSLTVAGVTVTNENAPDILGDGLFTYDAEANRLTVKGSFKSKDCVISSSIPNLTVFVANDSVLEATEDNPILVFSSLTFTGPGRMTVRSKNAAAIVVYNTSVTFSGVRADLRGGMVGLGTASKLTVSDGALSSDGGLVNFGGGIEFKGCEIVEPEGASVSDGAVNGKDGKVAGKVGIAPVYDLWLNGTRVNGLNCSDIGGYGSSSYDPAANVLTIGADVESESDAALVNGIPGLTLLATDDLTMKGGAVAILAKADMTITGPGRLTLEAEIGVLVREQVCLQIVDASVLVRFGSYGIRGEENSNRLRIRNSYVHAEGSEEAISGFDSGIQISDCSIKEPVGGKLSDRDDRVEDMNGGAAKSVTIDRPNYGFKVNGVTVNTVNADDVLGDGKFSYDPSTNVLTVRGESAFAVNAIENRNKGLTVYVAEDTKITSGGVAVISSSNDITITGPGKLTLEVLGKEGVVMFLESGVMTIEDADVTCRVEGKGKGITAGEHNENGLVVRNSRLQVSASSGAIAWLGSLTLDGCILKTPSDGRVSGGSVYAGDDDYDEFASFVVIEPVRYDLFVAGKQVTMANRDDILGDGAFSYDYLSKILYVSKSLKTDSAAIVNAIEGLTVYTEKDVTLDVGGEMTAGIITGADLTLSGPGMLRILATGSGIYVTGGSTLTINSARVYALGEYGITGGIGGNDRLVIRNSDVRAVSHLEGISGFRAGIELVDGTISEPEGGSIGFIGGGNYYAVTDDGGAVAQNVMIEKPEVYNLTVGGVLVTDTNAADVLGDGVFSYDPETNVLSVSGDFKDPGYFVISNWTPNLTLYVAADSKLSSDSADVITTSENMTITGPGKLTLKSRDESAVWIHGSKTVLTVRNAEIEASGKWGFYGTHDDGVGLNIVTSDVRAAGTESAVTGIRSTRMIDCVLTGPDGVTLTAAGSGFVDAEGAPAAEIVVEQAKYGLMIAGKQVKESNRDDILGNGVFSYDPETNTLTVDGECAVSKYGVSLIHNDINGLTVRIAGYSELRANGNVIYSNGDVRLTGPGLLKLIADGDFNGAVVLDGTMTIENARVDATGRSGLRGFSTGSGLTVRNSYVLAEGKADYGAVSDFYLGIELEGCDVERPEEWQIRYSGIADADGKEALIVEIMPEQYGLTVANVDVTSQNASDILNDGRFSYDPAENVLTVRGDCRVETFHVIRNGIPGLTVRVEEDVKLEAASAAIVTAKDLTLTGPGELTLKSKDACISVTEDATLTVEDAAVYANGALGFAGSSGKEKLTVRNSVLDVRGDDGAIRFFGDITLEGCEIVEPEDVGIVNGAVLDKDFKPVVTVKIGPKEYPLSVAGRDVTEFNAADVLGDGTVSYDPAANRLTIRGDLSGTNYAVYSMLPGLTIRVEKDATMTADLCTLVFGADTTITGPGKLTVEGSYRGIAVGYGATLTIKDADVDVESLSFQGINGLKEGEKLIIENSNLRARCCGPDSAICLFTGGVELVGCRLTVPDGGYFKDGDAFDKDGNPALEVAVEVDKPVNPFVDVKETDYFYDAVLWAVGCGITKGTDATHFSPNAGCTRGQVVTFLWRAAGSPEPAGTENPFKDVKETDYFYDAVLWAVENGVTAGTTKTTFSPDSTCTRGQIVTFLWRADGSPSPKGSSNPFVDVKESDYFYAAVLWAVENGVTAGTGKTTFSPNDTCTRGQVVTFLYRAK